MGKTFIFLTTEWDTLSPFLVKRQDRQYIFLTEEEPRIDSDPPGTRIDNEIYMTDHRAGQDLFGYSNTI